MQQTGYIRNIMAIHYYIPILMNLRMWVYHWTFAYIAYSSIQMWLPIRKDEPNADELHEDKLQELIANAYQNRYRCFYSNVGLELYCSGFVSR
jgi:hypothetical protein